MPHFLLQNLPMKLKYGNDYENQNSKTGSNLQAAAASPLQRL